MKTAMLATLAPNIAYISAGAAIYVVLTVFITISVLSITFIVLLFTVKGFRDLFFKPEKTKRTSRSKSSEAAPRASAQNKRESRSNGASTSDYSKTRSRKANDYDADGVPTIPLGGMIDDGHYTPRTKGTVKSEPTTLDNIPTVVIGGAPSSAPAVEKAPSHEVAASIRRERAAAKSAPTQAEQPKAAPAKPTSASAKTPAGTTKSKNADTVKRTTKK